MDTPYLNYIKAHLDALEPLEIQETGALAEYSKESGCKALIFDIYGTLIMSASGDIDQDQFSGDIYKDALTASGYEVKVEHPGELIKMHDVFALMLKIHKDREKLKGAPFPEVNIVEVWKDVLEETERLRLIKIKDASNLKLFVFVLELKSNMVWPMPGLCSVVETLKKTGIPLGIVSNAQFYTPVIMNYFLHGKITAREFIDGFEEDLSVFSYKELKGKPDIAIYQALLPALEKRGIQPDEVLFVGNDMLKDIYAASQVGFRTVFYAGDKRAYRLRQDHSEVKKVIPDHIVTNLSQIIEILN